jgi:hypothetical protein
MTLNSTGLGIGASPSYKLEVVAPAGDNIVSLFRSGDATAANNAGGGFRSISSATAASRVAQVWLDADGANLSGGDYFFIQKNGNSGTVDILQSSNAAMRFGTDYQNRAAFDMTIDASGSLLVGTASSLQNTSHSFKALGTSNSFWASTFQHDGTTGSPRLLGWRLPNSSDSNAYFVYAINSGGNCFNVFGNGSVTNSTGTYGTISDLRLKENISDARNYLADLMKLRVVKYSLKSEASAVATKIGLIAQEVEQVFPTLVETNSDEVKSIKTTVLIPMLLKAIQELTARVQTLEAK